MSWIGETVDGIGPISLQSGDEEVSRHSEIAANPPRGIFWVPAYKPRTRPLDWSRSGLNGFYIPFSTATPKRKTKHAKASRKRTIPSTFIN